MAYTTIDDPSAYLQTVLWSGSGSGQAITNGGNSDLQPDFVWIKKRAGGSARAHGLYDSSRGVTKLLHSNTDGANQTIAHGLGVTPTLIFIKRRDDAGDWTSYHASEGDEKFLRLNGNNALGDQATYFNDTTPTSTVFTVGSAGDVNTSSGTHVAYCFAEIQGYSKFGKYTGNNSADGTFVYTGFKPAFILIKRLDSTGSWVINDSTRNPTNQANNTLVPDENWVETTSDYYAMDILSNGFKFRKNSPEINGSSTSQIFMAFAEHPFVSSEGVPATAR